MYVHVFMYICMYDCVIFIYVRRFLFNWRCRQWVAMFLEIASMAIWLNAILSAVWIDWTFENTDWKVGERNCEELEGLATEKHRQMDREEGTQADTEKGRENGIVNGSTVWCSKSLMEETLQTRWVCLSLSCGWSSSSIQPSPRLTG